MTNSLRDQLLKQGLIDQKQLRQANSARHQERKRGQQGKDASADDAKARARQAQAEKAERDRALNRQHQEQARRKAIAAEIAQLIQTNRLPRGDGGSAFNFVDGKKVRRLYVSDEVRGRLGSGQLAIVALDGRYEVVPAAAAEKIRQRDPGCVLVLNQRPAADAAGPDPYAGYQVPDDLMW
ncbi:MAG: DUF2058 domain-containing protein [Pseudomonadota bacterium]|nr:DUF2058 domain-containing protein [Pseudomonadota bacterium]